MIGQVIYKLTYSYPAVMNELFTRHLLTAEECSELVRKDSWEREDPLTQILFTKPAEVVQEASQVLENHGFHVTKLQSRFPVLHYDTIWCHIHASQTAVMYIPTIFRMHSKM